MPQTKFMLQCDECKSQNYLTAKNRQNVSGKVVLRKHCPKCNAHTAHSEQRLRK